MVRIVFLVLPLLVIWATTEAAPQWFHFDTPRTGSKWPPYENADKGFWALQAEKLEEHKRVKKVASPQDSPVNIPVDSAANDSKSSKKPQKTPAKVVSAKIATRR